MTGDAIFSVRGKVALVTGAAAGLGRAMAEALAENGAHLTLFDRDAAPLAATARDLRALGAQVLDLAGDVTDAAAVERAVAETVARHGALDIAIANAGISDARPSLLHEVAPEDWARVLDVNLNGTFHTCRAALAVMAAQGHGKVITVASMWGLAAPAGAFPRPAYVFGSFTVAGLATVLLAIFLLEQQDRGFRTGEHLEAALDLPCLALMPVTTRSTGSRVAPHDHVQEKPRSRAAETMRGLIASLELADRAPRARAVLVTSALPGEGKSSLTLSLARVAANDGLRVLVVDADLRRPVLHEMLHREAAAGLQEILRGERRVGDVLLADDHSPLMLIPGCPREDQPARLLGRDGLGALIESARADFDLILVDSAPMMAVADARLIARMVDVTLFVCRFDSTGRAIAVRCVDQLREAGANIAGAVLSRVDPERHGRFGAAEAGIHRRDLAAYYAD